MVALRKELGRWYWSDAVAKVLAGDVLVAALLATPAAVAFQAAKDALTGAMAVLWSLIAGVFAYKGPRVPTVSESPDDLNPVFKPWALWRADMVKAIESESAASATARAAEVAANLRGNGWSPEAFAAALRAHVEAAGHPADEVDERLLLGQSKPTANERLASFVAVGLEGLVYRDVVAQFARRSPTADEVAAGANWIVGYADRLVTDIKSKGWDAHLLRRKAAPRLDALREWGSPVHKAAIGTLGSDLDDAVQGPGSQDDRLHKVARLLFAAGVVGVLTDARNAEPTLLWAIEVGAARRSSDAA
jgi:hypothetical protein